MKLPNFRKILAEDFPALEWLPQLVSPLNKFMEEINRALSNQLRIQDNFDGMVKTVVADGTYPLKFKWERKARPVAAWIGQCREVTENHTIRTEAIDLDWVYTADGMFQINAIPGLTATPSVKMNVTIIAITG